MCQGHPLFRHSAPKSPWVDDIRIRGCGKARVIGLVPHQILTRSLQFPVSARDIPDFRRDILKVVVCSRYHETACGVGLVHGFLLNRGAIASSISHDAHNIIAVGASDREILSAIDEVIRSRGAMVAVVGESKTDTSARLRRSDVNPAVRQGSRATERSA